MTPINYYLDEGMFFAALNFKHILNLNFDLTNFILKVISGL